MRFIFPSLGFLTIRSGSASPTETPKADCTRIPEGEYRFSLAEDKHLSIDVGQSPSTLWVDFTRDPTPLDEDSGLGSDHDEFYDLVPQQIRKRIDFRLDPDCSIVIDNRSALSFAQILDTIAPMVSKAVSSESLMARYDSGKSAIILGGWMELQRVSENVPSFTLVPEPLEKGHYVHISPSGMVCMIRVINASKMALAVIASPAVGADRDVRVVVEYSLLPHNKVLVKAGTNTPTEDLDFIRSMFNIMRGAPSSDLVMRYNPEEKSLSVGRAVFDLDSAKVIQPSAEDRATSNQV